MWLDNMLEFLRIILFANTVILTPNFIDLEPGRYEIELVEPISAITESAALYIDVSSMIPVDVKAISGARRWVSRAFPEGFVRAVLVDSSSDKELLLDFEGNTTWSDGNVKLILSSSSGVPTKIKYDKIVLETDVALRNVLLIWKNHSK